MNTNISEIFCYTLSSSSTISLAWGRWFRTTDSGWSDHSTCKLIRASQVYLTFDNSIQSNCHNSHAYGFYELLEKEKMLYDLSVTFQMLLFIEYLQIIQYTYFHSKFMDSILQRDLKYWWLNCWCFHKNTCSNPAVQFSHLLSI